jgi:dTDP-glucose 4,6-dehydratase
MRRDDGRAVPTFVSQALRGEPITVHGDGSQTRSLCYVDDLVEGLWRLFVSDLIGPVNLGNPEEVTVLELAERVRATVRAEVPIEFTERPEDDPQVRRPDISLARLELGWEPKVPLDTGLERMVAWASEAWAT